jgi:hypothetical protein
MSNIYFNGFDQRVARQQLCKHDTSRNNRENVLYGVRAAIVAMQLFRKQVSTIELRLLFDPCRGYMGEIPRITKAVL